MGSPPILDPTPSRRPGLDRPEEDHQLREQYGELLEHLQTPAAFGGHEFGEWPPHDIANGFGGDLHARHRHDHTRLTDQFTHTHPDLQRDPVREGEQAFDQLNPEFGVPADQRNRYGRQAVRDREAALALGTRVAVAAMRENDRDPGIRLAGQDYRAADAIHAARTQTVYVWRPVERVGAER
jgi:1,4-alpha-glucan branching enzyme